MTLPAGTNSEDEAGGKPGTDLAPVAENTAIDTFLAGMGEPEAPRPRSWRMRIFDYSAHVAMIAGLIGFAWMVSDHVVHRPAGASAVGVSGTAAGSSRQVAMAAPDRARPDEPQPEDQALQRNAAGRGSVDADASTPGAMAELRKTNARMADEIGALRAEIAAVKARVDSDHTRERISSLSASVDGVNNGLATARSETNAAIAQLSGKVDRMQRETHVASIDTGATGSLPPKSSAEAKPAPLPPVKPAKLASADDRSAADQPTPKPAVLAGWNVIDVYEGVALVEGKRGAMEVMPGVTIPGAGVVRSIDRSGGGWTVTTTKGVIAFGAPGRYARHVNAREPNRGYRYDF